MGDFPVKVSLQPVEGDIEGLRKRVQDQFNSPINVKLDMGEMGKSGGAKAAAAGISSIDAAFAKCGVTLKGYKDVSKVYGAQVLRNNALLKTAADSQKYLGTIYDTSTKKSRSETAELTRQTAAMNLANKQRLEAKRLITEGDAARKKTMSTENAFMRQQNQARNWYTKNQANIDEKGGRDAWLARIKQYGDMTQFGGDAISAQNDYLKFQKEWIDQGVTGQTKLNKTLLRARELTDFSKLEEQARDYYNTNYRNINKNAVLSARWQATMSKLQDPTKFGSTEAERIGGARSELAALRNESERAGVGIETLGQRLNRLFGAHLNTALVMAALHGLQQAVVAVYQNVVGLDKATVDLQIASGKSRNEVKGMMRDYSQTAKSLGATTLEVANSADAYLRQGKTVSEANTLIQNSMMLSKLGQLDSASASKYLTSTMKGYKISVEDSIGVVDKLTAVDMAAAINAGEIAEGISGTAVSADIAGISLDKLIGYIATVGEVTQGSGEELGTFFRSLTARMGNVKAGNLIDVEDGSLLSNVETVLTGYGIALRDSNSEFRNFGDVLDEVAGKWDTFGTVAQRAIAVAFAGRKACARTCRNARMCA